MMHSVIFFLFFFHLSFSSDDDEPSHLHHVDEDGDGHSAGTDEECMVDNDTSDSSEEGDDAEMRDAEEKVRYWEDLHTMVDDAQDWDEAMLRINAIDDPDEKKAEIDKYGKIKMNVARERIKNSDETSADKEKKLRDIDEMQEAVEELEEIREDVTGNLGNMFGMNPEDQAEHDRRLKEISLIRDPVRRSEEYAYYNDKLIERRREEAEVAKEKYKKFGRSIKKITSKLMPDEENLTNAEKRKRRRRKLRQEEEMEDLMEDIDLEDLSDMSLDELAGMLKTKRRRRKKLKDMTNAELNEMEDLLDELQDRKRGKSLGLGGLGGLGGGLGGLGDALGLGGDAFGLGGDLFDLDDMF